VSDADPTDRAGRPGAGVPQDDAARHAAGMAVRREVLGDAHVDRAVARTTEFTERFQDFITRYAWGELWTGDGIDRRTRSCLTLAILAAVGCEDEFAMHVRSALRNGVPAEHIREVLMHVAIYAGVPRANSAFALANTILAESDDES
jgi:4-carboxymuconolactone decarboxylase